jgi:hypothetical protein
MIMQILELERHLQLQLWRLKDNES